MVGRCGTVSSARTQRRASPRDGQKLAGFPAFLAAIPPDRPPAVAHIVVDNRDGTDLARQLDGISARFTGPGGDSPG